MAGMRKLKGKFYIRLRYQGKEKLIPTFTSIQRDAEIILRKYQQNEQEVKLKLTNHLLEQQLTIQDCIAFFKRSYKTEKGITQSTMDSYILAVRDFEYCFKYIDNFYDIIKKDYPLLVEYLQSRYNETTVNIRLRGIRTLLNYLKEKDYIKEISLIVKQVKTDAQEPKLITPEELKKIYKVVDNDLLLSAFKIYEVTGLRLSELNNSYRDRNFIVVLKSKSRKKRYIPIPKNYIEDYDRAVGCGYSMGWISKTFTEYSHRAGVYGKSLHCLRHTFAYKKLLETNNIQFVRDLLGHSSVKVTEIYTQMPMEYLKQIFQDNGTNSTDNLKLYAKA